MRTAAFVRLVRFPLVAGAVAIAAAVSVIVAIQSSRGPAALVPAVANPSGPAAPFRLDAVMGGRAVSLAGAAGRPVILSFFASWCDGCRQELGAMARLARAAGPVDIIGIDVNDEPGAARSLLLGDHITYPVGNDSGGDVASRYGLVGLPTTIYLDARHRIVGRTLGPLTTGQGRAWMLTLGGRAT